jgi:AraC family transcriptional regulator
MVRCEVNRHRLSPADIPEFTMPGLSVCLFQSPGPVDLEMRFAGRRVEGRIGQETVTIVPGGLPRSAICHADRGITLIIFAPRTPAEIAGAETGLSNPEIIPHVAINDPVVRGIGDALDAEVAADHPSPRIYGESLTAAMATHIFTKYSNSVMVKLAGVNLTKTMLRRSIEFIRDNLDQDLTLEEIASVANMSKFHFAKSFRKVVGLSPYQYLIHTRAEEARKLLTRSTLSIEEVARRVGYSDKKHFAIQFMKIVGISPHRYRDMS